MNEKNVELIDIEQELTMAEQECKDLLKFSNDISWFERDLVINDILGFFHNDLSNISNDMKERIDNMLEMIIELQRLNALHRPSRFQLLLDRKRKLRYGGQERPDYTTMMNIIQGLSSEQQSDLLNYIGIQYRKEDDTYSLLEKVARDGNLVQFFALRGRVGKIYMKFKHG